MEDHDIAAAREVLRGIKLFWCLDDADIAIKRLGGLTNQVFFVDHAGEQYVLRLPGPGTAEYINRANELQAAKAAALAGVSPDVVYSDVKSGIMITRFVDNAVTMTPEKFAAPGEAAARAGYALRKLHDSGAKFASRFELFKMIDDYLKLLATKEVELPLGYHQVLQDAEAVRAALQAHPLPSVACHCDPLCENFLDTGKRMWVVDWEYAGMNDPMWDLGDLCVEAGLSPAAEEQMFSAYFNGEATPQQRGRIVIYKAMCDLLWTLWGLIQHANKNPAEDFAAYALNRFKRCKALMNTDEFRTHVAVVAKGN
jgi:thiamine kinase-like enzyme